jgi:tetratricopeptide (TPR) repeat protein
MALITNESRARIRTALGALAVAASCLGACKTQELAPAQRGMTRIQEARGFLELGLPDSAWSSFGLALEDNPKLVAGHMGMARIWKDWGNYPLAHRGYETATFLAPNNFEAHQGLGLTKQLLGYVKDAVLVYLRALALNPQSFEVNHHLAGAYLLLDRPEEAVPYAERATTLNPHHQGAWSNLATAYNQSGRYEEAVDAYRHSVDLGQPEPPILLGLADAHIHLGHYSRAMIVLRNQIRQNPSAVAYERLGYCQFKRKDFDDALASFRAALSIDENDTAALNGLGACLMTLYVEADRRHPAQREEAIAVWRKSLDLRSNQPRIEALLSEYGQEAEATSE